MFGHRTVRDEHATYLKIDCQGWQLRRIKMKALNQMTDEEFMKGLYDEIIKLSPEKLLNVYGINEILVEQLHDAIVSQRETKQELPFANADETTL